MLFEQVALPTSPVTIVFLFLIHHGNTIQCYYELETFSYKIRDNAPSNCFTCLSFRDIQESFANQQCNFHTNTLNEQSYQEIEEPVRDYDYYDNHPRHDNMKHTLKINLHHNFNLTTIEHDSNNGVALNYYGLDLSHNYIHLIAPYSFKVFFNLIILNLAHNKILKLESNVFYGPGNLQTLNLQFNEIESLEHDLFSPLHELFNIDLSNNKIKYIPPNLFEHQEHLSVVLLNNNEIAVLDCICWNSPKFTIDLINLSWNHLNKTDLKTNVNKLLLDHNKLIKFATASVDFNELRLDFNNLTEFNVILPTSTTRLNLSVNIISNISQNVFTYATELTSLNLSNNHLKSLPTSGMKNLKKLMFLDISSNFLSQSSYGSENNWISLLLHLNNLQEVSLGRNLWECSHLKEIIQTLKFRSISVIPGDDHNKSNIVGISCIESSSNNSSVDSKFIEQVFEELWNRLTNESQIGLQLSNLTTELTHLKDIIRYNKRLSDRTHTNNMPLNTTETLNATSDKLDNLSRQIFNTSLKYDQIESRIVNLERKIEHLSLISNVGSDMNAKLKDLQAKYSELKNSRTNNSYYYYDDSKGTTRSNIASTYEEKIDTNIEDETTVKISRQSNKAEGSNILVKDQFNTSKIEILLESIRNASGSSVSIQTCLLILLLSVMISFLIMFVYKKIRLNTVTPRETIHLVQT